MLQHRPFTALGGNILPGVKAKLHIGVGGLGKPEHGPLGDLIVWNDDEFAPGMGFGLHPHANVEIITYVRQGAITHGDTLGNTGRTEAGSIQVMSAGTGLRHSEFNREEEPTRLFQIWLRPNQVGGPPAWSNRDLAAQDREGRFVVLASGDATDADALPLRANARLLAGLAKAGQTLALALGSRRQAYLVLARGAARVNGVELVARDGLVLQDEAELVLQAHEDTEAVLVELL